MGFFSHNEYNYYEALCKANEVIGKLQKENSDFKNEVELLSQQVNKLIDTIKDLRYEIDTQSGR